MLIAEIHGKYVPEARNSEDYLTSSVFGHLRYIQPGQFWDNLFGLAVSEPIDSTAITALEQIRRETGTVLSSFASVHAIFWPTHKLGEPDLMLHFSDGKQRPVVILVEAKLNATKSGVGKNDQLARYLHVLDTLGQLQPPLPANAVTLVVYLTTTDSRNELIASLGEYGDTEESRRRLYRLQWQDLVQAIDVTAANSELERRILGEVRRFLQVRNLEYFAGMDAVGSIPTVLEVDGDFLKDDPLFDLESIPEDLNTISERWMHGN